MVAEEPDPRRDPVGAGVVPAVGPETMVHERSIRSKTSKDIEMTLISMCMATILSVIGQPASSGFGSAKVAVVDIRVVSERYDKTRDLDAAFEQRRVAFDQQRDALRDKIQRTGRSLREELKPGTTEFDQRRKQLALYEAEHEWFVDTEGQKIEAGFAELLRMIYDDIKRVVGEVAEERGIDVVFAADRLPDEPVASATAARRQIMLQKVIYWSPRVDITEEVIARLNAAYKPQTVAPPGG